MKILVLFMALFVFTACQHPNKVASVDATGNGAKEAIDQLEKEYCSTTKEFITAYEYLKSKGDLYKRDWTHKTAKQVSKGCTGAAKRFVKVFEVLVRAELYTEDAAKYGIKAAQSTPEVTMAFLEAFQKSYLKNYLDLSLESALIVADKLSFSYNGDVKVAKGDFGKLVKFCVHAKQMDLPKPQCAKFSLRVSRYGEHTKHGVYTPFLSAFNFLTSQKGPNLSSYEAMGVAEKLVSVSPMATYNFIQAYKYGIDTKGMEMTIAQALGFANQLGSSSVRLPASTKTDMPTAPQK